MTSSVKISRWKAVFLAIPGLLLAGLLAVTVFVEREAASSLQSLVSNGEYKALILYHPSRDAHFTDDLSIAVARGLEEAGLAVDRATLTGDTPDRPTGYAVLVVLSNTYFWSPDLPTLRYLKRANLDGIRTVGIIAGAGATTRSQRVLQKALVQSGATVIAMRAFWTARPNDELRPSEGNRVVALDIARKLGVTVGRAAIANFKTLAPERFQMKGPAHPLRVSGR